MHLSTDLLTAYLYDTSINLSYVYTSRVLCAFVCMYHSSRLVVQLERTTRILAVGAGVDARKKHFHSD